MSTYIESNCISFVTHISFIIAYMTYHLSPLLTATPIDALAAIEGMKYTSLYSNREDQVIVTVYDGEVGSSVVVCEGLTLVVMK